MTRGSRTITVPTLSFLVIVLVTTLARAGVLGPKVEYSADSLFETADMKLKSKIHHAPGKERREIDTGDRQVTIVRWDRHVAWILMPSEKMYMETALKPGEADPSGYRIEKSEAVGEETIDGIRTTKNKVIIVDTEGNKLDGLTWVTKDGITVKLDAVATDAARNKTRMKMELKNVRLGKQDPQLFEIPPGYTKLSMGGFGPGTLGDMLKQEKGR